MNKILAVGLLLALSAVSAHADEGEKVVLDALHKLSPTANPDLLVKSELPGFYAVLVGGQLVFISADGKYLLQGDVVNIADKSSVSGRTLAKYRLEGLKALPASKQIVFAPANPKHTITVFTDIDCPYCRQFHKNIAAINQQGIAVHYVFFPLSIHPGADKKATAVWCAVDRNTAYTAAMNGADPGAKTCESPIKETTALALKLGISGTPTVLAHDGMQLGGNAILDPKALAAELDRLDKTPAAPK